MKKMPDKSFGKKDLIALKKTVRLITVIACLTVVMAAFFIVYYNFSLPDRFYVTRGSALEFDNNVSILAGADMSGRVGGKSAAGDTASAQLRLFGIFPIKTVEICECDPSSVIPCGSPFGIKMLTDGVMVVDIKGFRCGNEIVSPAADAGIRKGDVIMSISGKDVTCNEDIVSILSSGGGKTVGVKIMRSGVRSVVFMKPERSSEDGCWHAGMWVRDSSAGIGTMTFCDPVNGTFAGLGHPVCDIDTGEIIPLYSGEVSEVMINGVKRGYAGDPGELMGSFIPGKPCGSLDINCNEGLYGRIDRIPVSSEAVPVAMRQEVTPGEAVIYSTVRGCTPKCYSITIERIDLSDTDSRNMVIKVTDSALIDEAGGIVQGMSGSPIIQNGKLVGAVTHVFVDDPRRGYAIFADSMYQRMSTLAVDNEKDPRYTLRAG